MPLCGAGPVTPPRPQRPARCAGPRGAAPPWARPRAARSVVWRPPRFGWVFRAGACARRVWVGFERTCTRMSGGRGAASAGPGLRSADRAYHPPCMPRSCAFQTGRFGPLLFGLVERVTPGHVVLRRAASREAPGAGAARPSAARARASCPLPLACCVACSRARSPPAEAGSQPRASGLRPARTRARLPGPLARAARRGRRRPRVSCVRVCSVSDFPSALQPRPAGAPQGPVGR